MNVELKLYPAGKLKISLEWRRVVLTWIEEDGTQRVAVADSDDVVAIAKTVLKRYPQP